MALDTEIVGNAGACIDDYIRRHPEGKFNAEIILDEYPHLADYYEGGRTVAKNNVATACHNRCKGVNQRLVKDSPGWFEPIKQLAIKPSVPAQEKPDGLMAAFSESHRDEALLTAIETDREKQPEEAVTDMHPRMEPIMPEAGPAEPGTTAVVRRVDPMDALDNIRAMTAGLPVSDFAFSQNFEDGEAELKIKWKAPS